MIKMVKKIGIILLLSLLSFSLELCAQDQDGASDAKKVRMTFLDTINQGKECFISDSLSYTGKTTPTRGNFSSQDSKPASPAGTAGFRIQIIASNSLETVRSKQKEFDKAFGKELNLKSFVTYNEPYYKLFLGDFQDRTSAERILSKIKNNGYSDAWIVKSEQ